MMRHDCERPTASAGRRRDAARQAHPVRRRHRVRRQGGAVDVSLPISRYRQDVRAGAAGRRLVVGGSLLPEGRGLADVRSDSRALGRRHRRLPAREGACRSPATWRGRCSNFSEADLASIGKLDAIINCAGPGVVQSVARDGAAHQRARAQARARRGAQDRRRGGAHLDLLRRRQPRRRGLGRRAARRLLPAQGSRRRHADRHAARRRLLGRARDRRLPAHHRSGQDRAPTIARTSPSSATRARRGSRTKGATPTTSARSRSPCSASARCGWPRS